MVKEFQGKLIVGISSRALFDLTESHMIYEKDGIRAYADYQISHENNLLEPGPAFHLVKKLLNIRIEDKPMVEVILLSRNSPDTGLRVFNSIQHYGLAIERAAFTSGGSPQRYAQAFGAHLFLSAQPEDVRQALEAGYAAATILPTKVKGRDSDVLKIAFDGDAVLFSDEAERVYQQGGIEAFRVSERANADQPLSGGPFKQFLAALHIIQQAFPARQGPIRTALVTARSAPAHERVIRTLRAWDIRIDEALFLGGVEKRRFLQAFDADIFFDDQNTHCDAAKDDVPTGHVPHGIINNLP